LSVFKKSVAQAPTLGIVTPSFNQGEYLERAIVSVLDQKRPGDTYAVVDGGSTDNSREIIENYSRHLDFWCIEPDGGQSAAIVKGMGKVAGDIHGWLNSDDEYVNGTFDAVRKEFSRADDLVLVYGERILIDRASDVLGWTRSPAFDPRVSGYTIASETAFWRTSVEQTVGTLDPDLRFAMDLDFFIRVYNAGPSLKLNRYLGRFRCHDESKSATMWDVRDVESAALWHGFFGAEDENWRLPAAKSPIRHALAGLRHPRLLAGPYILHRLRVAGNRSQTGSSDDVSPRD
jgi:glycosyltransferase involved in cell wall biosynthesis